MGLPLSGGEASSGPRLTPRRATARPGGLAPGGSPAPLLLQTRAQKSLDVETLCE